MMIFNRKVAFIFLAFFTCLLFSGCNVKREEEIILDNSQPLALAPDISWAVVINPYASYKKDIGWDSESLGYCRKGEILQVVGRSQDATSNYWYYFKDGWLPAEYLMVYSNRYKAQTAAEGLLKQ